MTSLGEEPTEDEMKAIISKLDANGDGHISFEEFLNFVTTLTKDQDTEAEIVAAFRVLAGGRDYVTEDQMMTAMEKERVEYLKTVMPAHPDQAGAYDFVAWTKAAYN